MKRKGFMFLEILIGITFIGVICIFSMPILSSSFNSLNKVKERDYMSYICEMVTEKLKCSDEDTLVLINELIANNEMIYVDENIDPLKYSCMVYVISNYDLVLEYSVIVKLIKQENNYVEYKTSRIK